MCIDVICQECIIIYSIYFYLFYFCNFIVVNLFILNAQMLRCWGITIRFLDGKRTLQWYYCAVFIICW